MKELSDKLEVKAYQKKAKFEKPKKHDSKVKGKIARKKKKKQEKIKKIKQMIHKLKMLIAHILTMPIVILMLLVVNIMRFLCFIFEKLTDLLYKLICLKDKIISEISNKLIVIIPKVKNIIIKFKEEKDTFIHNDLIGTLKEKVYKLKGTKFCKKEFDMLICRLNEWKEKLQFLFKKVLKLPKDMKEMKPSVSFSHDTEFAISAGKSSETSPAKHHLKDKELNHMPTPSYPKKAAINDWGSKPKGNWQKKMPSVEESRPHSAGVFQFQAAKTSEKEIIIEKGFSDRIQNEQVVVSNNQKQRNPSVGSYKASTVTPKSILKSRDLSSDYKVQKNENGSNSHTSFSEKKKNLKEMWLNARTNNESHFFSKLHTNPKFSVSIPGKLRRRSMGSSDKYEPVREAIREVIDDPSYDDGSYGPVIIRLAWHAAGTYDTTTGTGGSNGGTMRFHPESSDDANKGLDNAMRVLERVKSQFQWISYGDLWTLAAVVAIEHMGGPQVPWTPGRLDVEKVVSESQKDCKVSDFIPENGRLPIAKNGADHIRQIFYRMGFSDREIVALIGAHSIGRCHRSLSGYDGTWDTQPTQFSNAFFQNLVGKFHANQWKLVEVAGSGNMQYIIRQTTSNEPEGQIMMLKTDMALVKDPSFRRWSELYAEDESAFFQDFSEAFGKLLELGVSRDNDGRATHLVKIR